jgi:D-alanyl-lipoteichoic acid acyltransferase DltB (MBOAT superfamily)
MLFNSSEFLVFFLCFGVLYTLAVLVRPRLALRTWIIVIASYVFYAQWDCRFTALLFFTSALDFSVARLLDISQSLRQRRALLASSIILNLGVLAVFKYFNFFRESLQVLLASFGLDYHWKIWMIVLPVGLSFYTFQSMSYVVDVYRRQLSACRSFVQFLAYDSFFPQLVAGPIGRGKLLLPQFGTSRSITLNDLQAGLWLGLWGMFKKVVLANNLAPLVDLVYQYSAPSLPMMALGTLAFGLQIYCDFSGYTDIACGLARMLGFNLGLNFNLPYLAGSLSEFWRRWHISLSTWLRDYLYIPLGGSHGSQARICLNLMVTMLLAGLWHGAALNFVLWGLWHGLGLVCYHLWDARRSGKRGLPTWIGWGLTQTFVFAGWMLFRVNSVDKLVEFAGALSIFTLPTWWPRYAANLFVLAVPLLAMHLWQWRTGKLDAPLTLPRWPRAALQATMLLLILAFWEHEDQTPFIYFQF